MANERRTHHDYSAYSDKPCSGGEQPESLDECKGHSTEAYGYHYHANRAEKNQILQCL